MDRPIRREQSLGRWVALGAGFGVVAGIVFAMFEMVAAWAMGDGFFTPLRMIGVIALGEQALEPTYSIAVAGIVGAVVHMMLSAVYGAVFGLVAGAISALRRSGAGLVVAASAFGLALWLVNFYVVAPIAFPWFGEANALVQFLAHTFFFGTVLGLLLAARRETAGRDAGEPHDVRAAEEPLAGERAEAPARRDRSGRRERV